jgi:thiol-disulfide isomerase/thioredoxin
MVSNPDYFSWDMADWFTTSQQTPRAQSPSANHSFTYIELLAQESPMLLTDMLAVLLLAILGLVYSDSDKIASFNDAMIADAESQIATGEWMLLFHADWCGPCQDTKPHFYKFVSWAKDNRPDLHIVGINHSEGAKLFEKLGVKYLPTILFVKDGQVRNFSDRRETLKEMFTDDEWKNVMPTTEWKNDKKSQSGRHFGNIAALSLLKSLSSTQKILAVVAFAGFALLASIVRFRATRAKAFKTK